MKFNYYAKKLGGEEVKGVMEAKDKFELGRLLRQQEYILISCKSAKEKAKFSFSNVTLGRISVVDKMVFSRNLSVMISAGLSLTRALEILSRQTANKKFQKIILSLMDSVQKGTALSVSMEKYPKTFSSLFTAMVQVGEESGKLSESLILVAEQLEKDHKLTRKVKGAMVYPTIVIFAMVVIGIFMLVYVVPTLVSTFKELDIELPASTRAIISASNFIINHTILLIISFTFIVLLISMFFRTKRGKNSLDIAFLYLPIISPLVKKINSSRTTRTLSSLLGSGINVVEALTITGNVLQNHRYKAVLEDAKKKTQKGEPMSSAFKNAEKLYPLLVGEMMAVGEETGELSAMLQRLAGFYEEEVDEATKDLSTVVEPVLMLFIGGFVGFFAISMIKPMYSMAGGF